MRAERKVASIPRPPRIYSRDEHSISRKYISPSALKVLYRLNNAGFMACLVGGGVRDLLLGREPKDFDIATDAIPEQVRELFRNCRLIGRRFRLAHIRFGREVIEVATFRAAHRADDDSAEVSEEGRILRDNVYGEVDDDVWRRDFTVNALYYDIRDFSVIDYVGGVEDLKRGILKVIGDPYQRYREDPVRMLRAVRFAVKLGFKLDDRTAEPLSELGDLLIEISPARLFDETLKLFHGGAALQTFEALRHYDLFSKLFPLTDAELEHQHGGFPGTLVGRALANTDTRIAASKSVTPAFLIAALLWDTVDNERQKLEAGGVDATDALSIAADKLLSEQVARLAVPRRFTQVTREIWALQLRLPKRTRKRVAKMIEHPRFRAAYDFLELRAESGEPVQELYEWWTEYQDADDTEREVLLDKVKNQSERKKKRRRRRHPQS
ncbi:MAG: polynucleotide adenylyltransferase PcnB [Gammaproteobacteria bacterium]|nr:polynucleotide adenylyltransferase PcnB [Gammaproteobacteria bacterium]MCZ6774343.1 polynucleotide adenylyltransferase PcnB [Pseudomonadota bacterium]MCZ6895146.1 polynucleotide adenylyltransferase PcnB [Gammaproteobacteria bacterium]